MSKALGNFEIRIGMHYGRGNELQMTCEVSSFSNLSNRFSDKNWTSPVDAGAMRVSLLKRWMDPSVEPRVLRRFFVPIAERIDLEHALKFYNLCIHARRFRSPTIRACVNDLARLGTKKPSVRWVCAG